MVLRDLETYGQAAQRRLLFEVSRAEDGFAVPVLIYLWQERRSFFSTYPNLYEILISKAARKETFIISRLQAGESCLPGYIWLCGEVGFASAVEPLLTLLHKTANAEEIGQIIKTLGRLGDDRGVKAVAEYAQFKDSDLAVEAVWALGRIGSPQAVSYLSGMIGSHVGLDRTVLDVCVREQREQHLEILHQMLTRGHPEVRGEAEQAMAEAGDPALSMLVKDLDQRDPDRQQAALRALRHTQAQKAVQPIRRLLRSHPRPEVRTEAYATLGSMELPPGAGYVLVAGLSDPEGSVRLAAARAVDRNATPLMISGIRNMLSDPDEQALTILRSLLQAQAATIISRLWGWPRFQELLHSLSGNDSDNLSHVIGSLKPLGEANETS